MAALTVGLNGGGIPAQLQLLLLQCLASTINDTKSENSYNKEKTDSHQSITISLDNDFFNDDANQRLTSLENNIKKIMQEFRTTLVEELKKYPLKSEFFKDIVNNFTSTSASYENKLQKSNEHSFRNIELQEKLLNLTQEEINTQNSWLKETSKMHNTYQGLEIMLANVSNRNEKLEETVISFLNNNSNFQKQILELTKNDEQQKARIGEKDKSIEQLEVKNQQLENELSKVTEKYRGLQQAVGQTEQQQNYCRISSNSVLWQLAHKDTEIKIPAGAFVWTPTHSEVAAGRMEILYSSSRDLYVREVGKEEMKGWNTGIYEQNSMFRMVENDFKVSYLARNVGTSEGTVSWKFDLGGSGTTAGNIKILFSTAVFFTGKVDAKLCSSSKCIDIATGNNVGVFETSKFEGVSQFMITARTTLGIKGAAWQHAQLFRQLLTDVTGYGFQMIVDLKRCDVLLL
ncbi:hypothetical protein L9F63_008667 [Diploptera punctata]|uniref:PAW domain-containing protein n=1 Tax=Diploptera punctata TaxID=6984 RepID=A0AAD7Z5P6_DIPPU|nr:hypothetical protein L9F63_008667 [Diploptera punctata]